MQRTDTRDSDTEIQIQTQIQKQIQMIRHGVDNKQRSQTTKGNINEITMCVGAESRILAEFTNSVRAQDGIIKGNEFFPHRVMTKNALK